MVTLSPSNNRPLAARSVMSAISDLVCEGKWSQRRRGEGLGDRVVCNAGWRRTGGLRVELYPSRDGCTLTRCLRTVRLWRRHRTPGLCGLRQGTL